MNATTFGSTGSIPLQPTKLDGDPAVDVRNGLVAIGTFCALFVCWGAMAPLDAAAVAPGRVTVSGHSQAIAHREGGTVSAVRVSEGQRVKAGQVLVELAPEDVGAQAKALSYQVISLEAQKARLTAELEGLPRIAWPDSFANETGEDRLAVSEAEEIQQAQFDADLGSLRAQQAINARRVASVSEQIRGAQTQLDANAQQEDLLGQQLTGMRTLAAKGYASLNSVRALERSAADLSGAHGQLAANIADYHQQIAAAELQSRDLERQHSVSAAASLRETQDELNALTPKLEAARDQLARGTLRAPVDGVVTGLNVFAAGSVVAPGQTLMEIVPLNPTLVVSTRVAAADVQGLHAGQSADVRLSSPIGRTAPILHGKLTLLSADSFADERTGQSYYSAEVSVPKAQLERFDHAEGAAADIRPGVPVQVMLPKEKRTALEFLFEPLTQALWGAFRQS
jgi:HlyD family secretion protein